MGGKVTTEPAVIHDILDRAQVLYLGLPEPEGPYVVPVNFVRGEHRLFIHSGREGRKVRALQSGGRVGFSACVDMDLRDGGEFACKWGYRFKSVTGSGRARFVDDETLRHSALSALIRKYTGSDHPMDEGVFAKTAIIEIEILSVTAKIKP